jgi:hypothetical protein
MSKQSESPVSVHIEKVEGLQGAAEEFVRLVRGSTKFSGVMPMVVENGLCIALTGTGPLGTENAHRIAAALNGSQAGFDIWRGTYQPATKEGRARVMRERIEANNALARWPFMTPDVPEPEQMGLL